jgi:hypothetical protein
VDVCDLHASPWDNDGSGCTHYRANITESNVHTPANVNQHLCPLVAMHVARPVS